MNTSINNLIRKVSFLSFLSVYLLFSSSAVMAKTDAKPFVKAFHSSGSHDFPAWFNENSFNDLEEITEDAISNGKKGLIALYTTQGCSYCEEFIKVSLGDSKIAKLVQDRFEMVGLELFDDTEMVSPSGDTTSVKNFALSEGAGFAPTLLFYGKDGKRVARQIGYQAPERFVHLMDYIAEEGYATQTFNDYLKPIIAKQNQSDPSKTKHVLKTDKLFDTPPYGLDRSHFAASEPLLVIFEKNSCEECSNFHADVLTVKEVRDTLDGFQVVRFDAEDDKTRILAPNGDKTTPAKWYKKTGFSRVPAILLFEEKGKEVMKTDALVLQGRMMNSLNYVIEKAYDKNWTYQQFARSKAIERSQATLQNAVQN